MKKLLISMLVAVVFLMAFTDDVEARKTTKTGSYVDVNGQRLYYFGILGWLAATDTFYLTIPSGFLKKQNVDDSVFTIYVATKPAAVDSECGFKMRLEWSLDGTTYKQVSTAIGTDSTSFGSNSGTVYTPTLATTIGKTWGLWAPYQRIIMFNNTATSVDSAASAKVYIGLPKD